MTESKKKIKIGILGVPFDYGVKLIKGRVGARFAPSKVKKEFFKRYNHTTNKTRNKNNYANIEIRNYGNVKIVREDCAKTHENVAAAVKKILSDNTLPVVIGGGHDISFGSGKALAEFYGKNGKNIGQINIDAHYDVRPVVEGKITSGTPFRRLLEGKFYDGKKMRHFLDGRNFVEFGAHAPKNLPEHYAYLMKQKASVIKLSYVNRVGIKNSLELAFNIAAKNRNNANKNSVTNVVAFDIDIDAVQKRFAPGCSAPGKDGFTKQQVLEAAFIAGKNKKVRLFNLMEINPLFDVKNKTVKLAAELIVSFARGLKERG